MCVKKILSCILVFSILAISFSQENNTQAREHKNNPVFYLKKAENFLISKLEIIAPKRTKVEYIKSLIALKDTEIYTKELHKKIYLTLWKTGLFYEIKIIPSIISDSIPSTVKLTIIPADKWTLIPIPIFAYTSSGFEGGLAFAERNLFGYGKTLVISGLYGQNRFFVNLIYIDPQLFKSKFSLYWINYVGISTYIDSVYGTSSLVLNDNNKVNKIIRKSQGLNSSTKLRLRYNILDDLFASISIEYLYFNDDIIMKENFETLFPIQSSSYIPLSLGIEYSRIKPFGILKQGLTSAITYHFSQTSTFDEFHHSISTKVSYRLGLGNKQIHLINFSTAAQYGNFPLLLTNRLGGTPTNLSISKSSLLSNKHISLSTEHIINVWKNSKFGIITSYGADMSLYELTNYNKIDSPILNGGFFISSGVLLEQVAIPLVKIILGLNIPAQYCIIEVSVGVP